MKKKQLLLIHGAETFRNKKDYLDYLKNKSISLEKRISWSGDYLDNSLGKYFQIIRPRMPLQENSHYAEWKIMFERYLELLDEEVVLIGNSLGGIFLTKYLSENTIPKKILSLCLIAAPFSDALVEDNLVNGFRLKNNLKKISDQVDNINFFFSSNDKCVPVENMKAYEKKIPEANYFLLDNITGHFFVKKFPELIRVIKKDLDIK